MIEVRQETCGYLGQRIRPDGPNAKARSRVLLAGGKEAAALLPGGVEAHLQRAPIERELCETGVVRALGQQPGPGPPSPRPP